MSFDLNVTMAGRPRNLRQAWEREFALAGFDVEIVPTFDADKWLGGGLRFRVMKAPFELVGVKFDEPVLGAFEVSFTADSAHFRTAMGRTTIDFALQCLGAAILTKLSGGRYIDPQNDLNCDAQHALAAASKEISYFVMAANEKELAKTPFPGWEVV